LPTLSLRLSTYDTATLDDIADYTRLSEKLESISKINETLLGMCTEVELANGRFRREVLGQTDGDADGVPEHVRRKRVLFSSIDEDLQRCRRAQQSLNSRVTQLQADQQYVQRLEREVSDFVTSRRAEADSLREYLQQQQRQHQQHQQQYQSQQPYGGVPAYGQQASAPPSSGYGMPGGYGMPSQQHQQPGQQPGQQYPPTSGGYNPPHYGNRPYGQ
ncbi:MAG: hypothetical protein MHM6MM_004788, partial [Cercozoa sp. M6MM]